MEPIRFSAPGRAGIIGNPSDLYGGTVISCAIPLRARCQLEPSERLIFQIGSQRVQPETLTLQGDELDIFRAALVGLGFEIPTARFTLLAETEIPVQAGLAGSTALLTALLACLLQYRDGGWKSPYHLAETVRQIESQVLKVTCGFQDHYMAVFGGLQYMDFRGKERQQQQHQAPFATVEPLSFEKPEIRLPLWLAFTGATRSSAQVHTNLRTRWEEGEQAVRGGMERIAILAQEGKQAFLEQDWHRLAALMNENYRVIRELGGSGEALDRLVQVAMENGALGAKLAGAGGTGGTVIVLTLEPNRTLSALREYAPLILPLAPRAPGLMRF